MLQKLLCQPKASMHLDYHEHNLQRKQQIEPGIFEDQTGIWYAPNPPYQMDLQSTQPDSLPNTKRKVTVLAMAMLTPTVEEPKTKEKSEATIPEQSCLYISIISSPDLKFCPDLFGVLKSKSYLVPCIQKVLKQKPFSHCFQERITMSTLKPV